ncbi:unnamed protein product [Musa acuminata var. zebrina]
MELRKLLTVSRRPLLLSGRFASTSAVAALANPTADAPSLAKPPLKSSLQLHIDGTSPVAEDIGRQVMIFSFSGSILTYVHRIPVAEFFVRINAVDANTVKHVANRFIFDQDVVIAAMGPIQGLPDYNWFRRRTYLLRY